MELKWLQDFISLANTGSFSKAAENRNVTQSAFSRRIRALEDWLGTTLVNRTTHPITLTDSGVRFVETAEQTIRMLYKVREDFATRDARRKSTLTIGMANHLSIHFFPAWLQAISKETDPFNLRLLSNIKGGIDFFESLKHQEHDFLVLYGGAISSISLDSSKYESITLGQDCLVPVCEAKLLDEKQYYLPGTRSKPLPYISYMRYSSMTKAIADLTTNSSKPLFLDTGIETSTAEGIKALVLQKFGVAWLPLTAIRRELEDGTLKEIGDDNYRIPLSIEIYRYIPNTKPEIILLWDKLRKITVDGGLS